MLPEIAREHLDELVKTVVHLLDQAPILYSSATPSSFPEAKGVYVITSAQGEVLRAGKTGDKNATLRQRLYRNHLMGDQPGNLRAQLVASGICSDLEGAKNWIRKNCSARFLEIPADSVRANFEHFMLAVLQPRFCDNNRDSKEN